MHQSIHLERHLVLTPDQVSQISQIAEWLYKSAWSDWDKIILNRVT